MGEVAGYGDGYGYGSSDGSGYGSGSGEGSSSGYPEYWAASIPGLVAAWSDAQRARYDAAQRDGATVAYWRSNSDGTPANGGHGPARKVGDMEEVSGPLELCGGHALHATLTPGKWAGAKFWVVALYGEVQSDETKLGALKREILGEAWVWEE